MEPTTKFYTQVAVLLTLIVVLSAGGGLAIVGLRREIDESARRMQAHDRERHRLSEKIAYLDGQIARLHTAESLQERIAQTGLGLTRPSERQIVRLELRPVEVLAEAARREAGSDGAATMVTATPVIEPFRTSYGLAVLGRD